ncbi:hypothetical protein [Azotobacter salinestris]|uniref:hypothetical protein n=1 Tax=Azotobacter salinestris TaxID=69964 RepID=UPI001266DCB4|nr:hypothetical protein [Azotobacter salinestris]
MDQNLEDIAPKSKPRFLTVMLCILALPPFLYLAGIINVSPLDALGLIGLRGDSSVVLPVATQEAVSRVAGAFSWMPVYVVVAMIARRYLD